MPGLFDGTSLEQPVTCERCEQALSDCSCPRDARGNVVNPSSQHPRVRREKRRGKWNTVVGGLDAEAADLKGLLKTLRTACGTGGGVSDSKDGPELVLQGDHRDKVVKLLIEQGYKAKASGG
ncbi:MAG: translation initiation factor [Planctomycetota bacterium]